MAERSSTDGPQAAVQTALAGFLDDGELVIQWCVVIDIATPDGGRYLAQRFGGGMDGSDMPTIWSVAGMLQAAGDAARQQMTNGTREIDDAEGEDDS